MIKAKLVLPDVAAVPSKDQSDWNVNDPNAAGYVKNRTHYKEEDINYIPVIESAIIEFTEDSGRFVAAVEDVSFSDGVYKVIVRGTEGLYESVKVDYTYYITADNGIVLSCIDGANFITVVDENATTSYQASLSLYLQDIDTTYHKLQVEYIPTDEVAQEIFPTLDVNADISDVANDIVTLKRGITNKNGRIRNTNIEDIHLAKVAKTGSYNDLSNKPQDIATRSYVNTQIGAHNTSASSHSDIRNDVSGLKAVVPTDATVNNKLTSKSYVDTQISLNNAEYRGTSAKNLTEVQFLNWANSLTHNINDYVFWDVVDSTGNEQLKLYQFKNNAWTYLFSIETAGFTQEQWDAIDSGATSELIGQITTNKNAIESLATVARTGSYNDLTNKPAWVQSDWSTNDSSGASYIANRTHYTTETVIIDSKNLSFTTNGNVSQCVVSNLTLSEGYYKIRIRGIEGVYRCFREGTVYTINIYSNPDNITFTYNDGDTSTTIVNSTTVGAHTTYLGLSSLVITQLAEYYIPATVARVSQIPTSNSQLTNDEGYITASNNLSDVGNRQTALNNITNATTQSVEKVLSLGDDGNASWKDRFERAAGVTANEVSVHDHRGNFSSATDVYVPLMSFRHLNSMRKFQIEFSLMAADATIAEYPVYYARYVFFRSTIYGVEGKFMCVDCASTNDTLFRMNDVVAVSSTEGGYTYTTFYKKNAGIYDWNMYCIHSMSTFSYNGQTGYVVPTYYVGSYATDLKSGEVRVTDSMLRHYSDFTTVYPCMDKTGAYRLEWTELSAN